MDRVLGARIFRALGLEEKGELRGTEGSVSIVSKVCAESLQSLQPCGPQPTRLLCPWDSPGKNTRVGSHFLLTQGLNSRVSCFLY